MKKLQAGLSFIELKASIMQTDPVDEQGNRYSLSSSIGSFPCFGVIDGNTGKTKVLVSDAQKDIGLGPTLMLMTTRSLAFLFCILSLINMPLYVIYLKNHFSFMNLSLPELFSKTSLGNIGEDSTICETMKYTPEGFSS